MNDITKEKIQRLEKVGIAIADSIADEYNVLHNRSENNKKTINNLYCEFEKMLIKINEEEVQNEN